MLSKAEQKSNADYFIKIAKITKSYLWANEGVYFTISPTNKYICDNDEKQKLMKSHCGRTFYKDNCIEN